MNSNGSYPLINEDYVVDTVMDLADLYENNISTQEGRTGLTHIGFTALHVLFGEVPIELRAVVYQGLVQELKDRGLEIDVRDVVGNA